MTWLSKIILLLVVLGAVGLFISWKLYAYEDQTRHESEYRKHLLDTANNVFDAHSLSEPEDAFRIYAVNVVHTTVPFRRWFIGDGVYLGNGTVLTAAHVIGKLSFLTNPRVFIAGLDLPARVIKEGSADRVDLALLSVDRKRLPIILQMRKIVLCSGPIHVGRKVVVPYTEKIVNTQIMSPMLIPAYVRSKYNTLINEAEGSGSAVFDAHKTCLLGIISREVEKFKPHEENGVITLEPGSFGGYFVPASQIRKFLPNGFKF
jgi:hypothetical protein